MTATETSYFANKTNYFQSVLLSVIWTSSHKGAHYCTSIQMPVHIALIYGQ